MSPTWCNRRCCGPKAGSAWSHRAAADCHHAIDRSGAASVIRRRNRSQYRVGQCCGLAERERVAPHDFDHHERNAVAKAGLLVAERKDKGAAKHEPHRARGKAANTYDLTVYASPWAWRREREIPIIPA